MSGDDPGTGTTTATDDDEPELVLGPSAAHVAKATTATVATIVILVLAVGTSFLVAANEFSPFSWLNDDRCDQEGEAGEARARAASGEDLDERSFCHEDTAVLLAIRSGDEELLEALLMAGASPDVPTKSGQPPTWFALSFGQHEALRLLIEAGADPDLRRTEVPGSFAGIPQITWTLLQRATYDADAATVEVLLEAGADPSITMEVHVALARNVLSVAARRATPTTAALGTTAAATPAPSEPLDRLLAGTDPITADPLLAAAAQHASWASLERVGEPPPPSERATVTWTSIARMLLEHDAPVDGAPDVDVTPLYLAARFGDEQMVSLLLRAGADRSIEIDGWTPLDAARHGGWTEVIALLEPRPPVL